MRRSLIGAFILLAATFISRQGFCEEVADRLKALEDRIRSLEGAPAKASLSAFNPAMGMALDTVYRHEDAKGSFLLRAAELNVEAPIDPFLKGWAIITGSNDGVDVEEVALETTSLPGNLTFRGGRLFASFGRLAHFHDHELPVIDRPRSLDAYIGGETQADGFETSFLFPTKTYVNATVGMYNKIGAENNRVDNGVPRGIAEFTYLARLNAYADIGDNHSVEVGVDSAWTPKRVVKADTGSTPAQMLTVRNTWRTLSGVDVTYRYQPAQGGIYRGVVWGTEILNNNENRFDTATNLPMSRENAWGGFSYIQVKMGPRWKPGVMVDLSEDPDHARRMLRTFSGFLTYDLTEFQKLRLVYSLVTNNTPGQAKNNIIALQWTGVLGHHVHGFRDR